MLVKSVFVRNFRSFQEAEIELEDLTALVGRNGTGKSSLLRSLE